MSAALNGSETAYDRVITAIERLGLRVKPNGKGVVAQCPAHEDNSPSLGVLPLPDSVSLHCFAGCENGDVVEALGLTMRDLFDNRRDVRYQYPDGRRVIREWDPNTRKKTFRQANNDGKNALFRVAEVVAAIAAGRWVLLVEGEKDVLAVESVGGVATCWAGGVSGWRHCGSAGLDADALADVGEGGRDAPQGAGSGCAHPSGRPPACPITPAPTRGRGSRVKGGRRPSRSDAQHP